MDKVFFDTNILLDVLQKREPYYPDSFQVLNVALKGSVKGAISPISIADITYIARDIPLKELIRFFRWLRTRFDVAPVNANIIDAMLHSEWKDLEDGIQFHAAQAWGAQCLLTRNAKDFAKESALSVLTPRQFLTQRESI